MWNSSPSKYLERTRITSYNVCYTKLLRSGSPIPMGTAISLVIGIFIVGTVLSPDIARWARTPKHAVTAAFIGFFVGNSFMTVIAIFLSRLMDTDDLTNIFIMLGLGLPAIIVLTLAQWTTNTNNLYSASLGFSVVFRNNFV